MSPTNLNLSQIFMEEWNATYINSLVVTEHLMTEYFKLWSLIGVKVFHFHKFRFGGDMLNDGVVLLDQTVTSVTKSAIYCPPSQDPEQTQLHPWCCLGDPLVGQGQLSTMPWLLPYRAAQKLGSIRRVKISFFGGKYDIWRPWKVPDVEIMIPIHYKVL